MREFKVERRRGGTGGSNRNRSMWSARVEWRDSIRRKDRRACRAKSGAQLRDFPYGSSRLRLKISRVSPIPDPFKNRLSILLARENVTGAGNFLSLVYSAREWKGEGKRKRGFKRRHSNHSFAILERKYVRSNEERGDATISRTSRSKVRFDSFLFLPFLRVFSIGKKKKKKEGKRRNSTLNGEGRNRNGRGGNSRGFPIVVVIPRPARWPTRFEWKSNGRVAGIGK